MFHGSPDRRPPRLVDNKRGAPEEDRAAAARRTRSREGGFSVLELAGATAILGVLLLLLMPSLQGYQTNAEIRSVAATAVSQMRLAQMSALSQDQDVNLLYNPTGDRPSRGWQGWEICTAINSCAFSPTDNPVYKTVVPLAVHITAFCYRGAFAPNGQYVNWNGVCPNVGATVEALCFDSGTSEPYKTLLLVTVAMGQVTTKTGVGVCP